jgi:hypothetical protein
MRADEARAAAKDWIARHGGRTPGFAGAWFSGSTLTLAADDEVPPGSDTDVMAVLDTGRPPPKPGKFRHRGALLEVTWLPLRDVARPEDVLGDYHLAGPFRPDTAADPVIADPTGHLAALREQVRARFADPAWVRRRVAHALARVEGGLTALDPALPWPRLVLAWLFPTGVTTHVLLVAGLRNPTVRLRYGAVRDLLAAHGRTAWYDDLLAPLGCEGLDAVRARHHLAVLAETFDATAAVARTPLPWTSDLTPAARPITVDGTAREIAAGRHREVVFWLVACFARCHVQLAADAPALGRDLAPGFDALLADLGVTAPRDLTGRAAGVLAGLPRLRARAEELLVRAPASPAAPGRAVSRPSVPAAAAPRRRCRRRRSRPPATARPASPSPAWCPPPAAPGGAPGGRR